MNEEFAKRIWIGNQLGHMVWDWMCVEVAPAYYNTNLKYLQLLFRTEELQKQKQGCYTCTKRVQCVYYTSPQKKEDDCQYWEGKQ